MFVAITVILVILVFLIVKRSDIIGFSGRIKFSNGDLKGALAKYELAHKIGKLNAEGLFFFGYLLLRDGQLDRSREIFTLASMNAKKDDLRKRVKAMLAIAEWKSGNLDNAIEMTEEVMKDYKNTNIYQNLGLMYVVKGDAEKAVSFNEEAFDYNSDDMIIMDNLAESYAISGDFEKASELYEKLLEKEPHFPEPYYGYGLLLVKNGEKDRGIELIEKSLGKRFSFLSLLPKEEVKKLLENAKKE